VRLASPPVYTKSRALVPCFFPLLAGKSRRLTASVILFGLGLVALGAALIIALLTVA